MSLIKGKLIIRIRPCFHGKLLSCAALRCSCMKACHVNRGNAQSPTLATWRHDDVMKWQVAWPKLARRGHQNLGFVVACCWPSLPPLSHLFGDTRQCLRHCRFTSSKVDWYVTSILNPSHKQRYTKYTKIATNTPRFYLGILPTDDKHTTHRARQNSICKQPE